jgi:hypothetical protein
MRWHVSNAAYGEHWTAGDVIGCCIDLDAGSMRFLRNGKDLVRRQTAWHPALQAGLPPQPSLCWLLRRRGLLTLLPACLPGALCVRHGSVCLSDGLD